MDNTTHHPSPTPARTPYVVHRRPPGLHWWTDHHGRDHGPVHIKPARRDSRAARRKAMESEVAA